LAAAAVGCAGTAVGAVTLAAAGAGALVGGGATGTHAATITSAATANPAKITRRFIFLLLILGTSRID
jgi:hypothetical protein